MTSSTKDFIRGSINNRPFRPGGLDDSQTLERILPDGVSNGEWVRELLSGGPCQDNPPGLKQGLDLGDLKVNSLSVRILLSFYMLWNSSFANLFVIYFLKAYPSAWNVCKDQSLPECVSDEKQVS